MAVALLFTLLVLAAGYGVLRVLGLAKGAASFGLAPATGVAVLSIAASWAMALRLPAPVAGVLLLAVAGLGVALAVGDRRAALQALASVARDQRLALAVLGLALAVQGLLLATAFGGLQVPLSPHDGAYHTQVMHAFRMGEAWSDWYPKGTAALFGAFLQLVPWLDTAQGAVELGLSLTLLAVLAIFGLGLAVWRNLLLAGLGALLLSLTYLYPYFPQIWSGWPLASGLILVMGVWAVALDYLQAQSWRWGALGGLLVGAVVLVHGTELYTIALVLVVVLLTRRSSVDWVVLGKHVTLGVGVAMVCAAAYLPTLLVWATGGGAYQVGIGDGVSLGTEQPSTDELPLYLVFTVQALGIDLPIRLVLLAVGAVWAVRQRAGLSAVGVLAVFAGLMLVFVFVPSIEVVRQVYAVTFPWGMHYRLLMLVAIAQALLSGAGVLVLGRMVWRGSGGAWARRGRRLGRLLLATWLVLTTAGSVAFIGRQVGAVHAYGPDDAAAMAWLRAQADGDVLVANDGFADAGIWAPYKAGVDIVLPRSFPLDADAAQRRLVVDNLDRLDSVPEARAAACALGVDYLYRGAATSSWDERRLPSAEDLRRLPYLEEAFRQGEASVFRLRLPCPS